MTSTIKVNTITTESGSTLTVGGCGKTVALASGASQTGFGRTGTVDWQTGSIKTATFTAANGEGYFANTGGGAFTMNLPAGSAGAIVSVQDYNNTFDTHALTVAPNGSEKINGGAAGASTSLNTQGQGVTLVYIDGTIGWRSVQSNEFDKIGESFMAATGGTVTTCGDFKIHTFTGPGTFCVSAISSSTPANNIVDYVVVAGGGGARTYGGGGGAGGFRYYANTSTNSQTGAPAAPINNFPSGTAITATVTAFPITVGAGGGGPSSLPGNADSGNPSTFSTVTSAGGGGGGKYGEPSGTAGSAGGSGGSGGLAGPGSQTGGAGGAGNTPPVSPAQGFAGGSSGKASPGTTTGYGGSGGGGGALAVGVSVPPTTFNSAGGNGGAGAGVKGFGSSGEVSSCVSYFSGGGGGTYGLTPSPGASGTGGLGGGGDGKTATGSCTNANGTANTGGGAAGSVCNSAGQSGGSGIVIIRYKFQ